MNKMYIKIANTNIELYKDVLPTFSLLRKNNFGICILTNGHSDGQRKKIRH